MTHSCPTRRASDPLRRHDCKRVFIAIDAALLDSDVYGRIHTTLKDAGIAVSQYSDIEPDPSADTVARAYGVCQAHEATMQLAIGGGSTIDVAKAVGILATNGGRIHDYEGTEKFSTPGLPLIAVPSTAGTGTEVKIGRAAGRESVGQ